MATDDFCIEGIYSATARRDDAAALERMFAPMPERIVEDVRKSAKGDGIA